MKVDTGGGLEVPNQATRVICLSKISPSALLSIIIQMHTL